MSERQSRASSLSFVSGIGTSSVSGISDSGHVNIEELDDDHLKSIVKDLKENIMKGRTETEIFESYYERLISGNLTFTNTSSSQSRKTSTTQSSTITPESDSLIQTPSTILDPSQRGGAGRLSRKKSSSRTSLASRHKSIKLSDEQRCGIARKELARVECELNQNKSAALKEIKDGNFLLEERALRIKELNKDLVRLNNTRLIFTRLIEQEDACGKASRIVDIIKDESKYQIRCLDKMKIRNEVMKSEILKIGNLIRKKRAIVEEIGPVDHSQLQIENSKYVHDFQSIEIKINHYRQSLRSVRLQMDIYGKEHFSKLEENKKLVNEIKKFESATIQIEKALQLTLTELNHKKSEVVKLKKKYPKSLSPSIEYLFSRHLEIEKEDKENRVAERKKRLISLKSLSARSIKYEDASETKKNLEPVLYKGVTYDLFFCIPDK